MVFKFVLITVLLWKPITGHLQAVELKNNYQTYGIEIVSADNELVEPAGSQVYQLASEPQICPRDLGESTVCHLIDSGCYCLVQIRQNWRESRDFCRSHGMDLVAIETSKEQQDVASLLQTVPRQVSRWWTSAWLNGRTGHWTWRSTGQPMDYNNWESGQPSGSLWDSFVQIGSQRRHFKWFTFPLTSREYSICEY